MSNWAFVAISYGLTWTVLIGYAVLTVHKLRLAERQLAAAAPERTGSDRLVRVERLVSTEVVG
jgi:hypothetical protein